MISRLVNRSRQFWIAVFGPHSEVPSNALLTCLKPAQLILFRKLQPSEQVHAYKVFKSLEAAGQTDQDLLVAALLHDVGKTLYPLSIFDQVIFILGNQLFQGKVQRWSEGPAYGLHLPFVVAVHHPEWGADLASQAGSTPRSVELIRFHHEKALASLRSPFGIQLAALQTATDQGGGLFERAFRSSLSGNSTTAAPPPKKKKKKV